MVKQVKTKIKTTHKSLEKMTTRQDETRSDSYYTIGNKDTHNETKEHLLPLMTLLLVWTVPSISKPDKTRQDETEAHFTNSTRHSDL